MVSTKLLTLFMVIDVSKNALKDPDYQISIEDFTNWESSFGKIPNDVIVLLFFCLVFFFKDYRKF